MGHRVLISNKSLVQNKDKKIMVGTAMVSLSLWILLLR